MGKMGVRINQKRKELGLTMQELADRLGVQASAVNKWEKGTVENIKRSTIQEMAKMFDCSPVWLMGYDNDDMVEATDYAVDYIQQLSEDDFILIETKKKLSDIDVKRFMKMVETMFPEQYAQAKEEVKNED